MHQLGKYKEAVDCYDKALHINPNIGQIWYNKGLSIEMMKSGFGKFFKLANKDSKMCFDGEVEAFDGLPEDTRSSPRILPWIGQGIEAESWSLSNQITALF